MKETIREAIGITGLSEWLIILPQLGYTYEIKKNNIIISNLYNKSICFGKIKKKGYFLAFDHIFSKWAKFINWEKVVINKARQQIHLVSKGLNIEAEISQFAITFNIDIADRLNYLSEIEEIYIRKYHIENDTNRLIVDRYKPLALCDVVVGKLELNIKNNNIEIQKEIAIETSAGELFKIKNEL